MQQLLRCGIFGGWTLKTRSMTTRTPQPLFDARKITIMAAAGTLLPLFCLAFAFAFTPLPVTPRDFYAREITERFHGRSGADAAEEDFARRSAGGVPDQIPELALTGAPLGIGALLKQAGLVASGSEALRLVEQGGVRLDGAVVSDKGLKVGAGTVVVQVGKRKFARVMLS